MITVGIFEAKSSLGQLVQSAASGEVVILTRRGKPIAEIRAPQADIGQGSTAQAIEALRKFRRNNAVGDFDSAKLVAEGRRRWQRKPRPSMSSTPRSASAGCSTNRPTPTAKQP